jgi:predicted GNAT family acetyltransferase
MEARVVDNGPALRYELYVGEDLAGIIAYARRDGRVTLLHTEISPEFGGQGLGGTLVAGALEDLREKGLEMVPSCPFVRSYLERHPA